MFMFSPFSFLTGHWLTQSTAAILIACIVSFRTLFVSQDRAREQRAIASRARKERANEMERRQMSTFRRMRGRLRDAHDTFLETFRSPDEDEAETTTCSTTLGATDGSDTINGDDLDASKPAKEKASSSVEKVDAGHLA